MPANRGISTLPLFSAFQEIYSGCCTVAAQVQEEQGQGPVQRLITLPVRLFLLYGQPIVLTNQDLTRLLANSFATTSGFVRCTLEAPWPPQLPPSTPASPRRGASRGTSSSRPSASRLLSSIVLPVVSLSQPMAWSSLSSGPPRFFLPIVVLSFSSWR
jgi:hypothetical protein